MWIVVGAQQLPALHTENCFHVPGAHAGAFPRFEAARSSRAFAATNAASASATLLNLIEPRAFTWLYVSPPRAASISFMLFS